MSDLQNICSPINTSLNNLANSNTKAVSKSLTYASITQQKISQQIGPSNSNNELNSSDNINHKLIISNIDSAHTSTPLIFKSHFATLFPNAKLVKVSPSI